MAQTVTAALVVAAAAFFVGRRLWRNARGHGDGACDKCGPRSQPRSPR